MKFEPIYHFYFKKREKNQKNYINNNQNIKKNYALPYFFQMKIRCKQAKQKNFFFTGKFSYL